MANLISARQIAIKAIEAYQYGQYGARCDIKPCSLSTAYRRWCDFSRYGTTADFVPFGSRKWKLNADNVALVVGVIFNPDCDQSLCRWMTDLKCRVCDSFSIPRYCL